eukprot:CAMPEP_0170560888 /NCGR_PEP_ID=MMETSP0211-20121228/51648_1 /TAXON_ID=311385 /ORGANISM="Pseudokeronopsis sp., Strain OXSARD2" /LENGTH=69 /DNA_ID=CAMNT_0010875709 /DNA_START=6 /DNA_END=211 /DNA_ORIENTATION=+
MYFINEGNNLEPKEQSIIERIVDLQLIPKSKSLSRVLNNAMINIKESSFYSESHNPNEWLASMNNYSKL